MPVSIGMDIYSSKCIPQAPGAECQQQWHLLRLFHQYKSATAWHMIMMNENLLQWIVVVLNMSTSVEQATAHVLGMLQWQTISPVHDVQCSVLGLEGIRIVAVDASVHDCRHYVSAWAHEATTKRAGCCDVSWAIHPEAQSAHVACKWFSVHIKWWLVVFSAFKL